MSKKDKKPFKLISFFDTETTNINRREQSVAFVNLYIVNDCRNVDFFTYEPDCKEEQILFYRKQEEMLDYIYKCIQLGRENKYVPIVAAYNLMFDLQTILFSLSKKFEIAANAQSSTNAYTVDLKVDDEIVLRFWDMFHLDTRGLAALGQVAGVEKAIGDWDYTLIRTPATELTDDELFYAKRDVQVLPAYIRYLLQANDWLEVEDLGFKVLTKTSLVRQMAKNEVGNEIVILKNGKPLSLFAIYMMTCGAEKPKSFKSYCLRKACFRGGFTFTSARYANEVVKNVASLDVTSMHHTYINGRYIPVKFEEANLRRLNLAAKTIIYTPLEGVLKNYYNPFTFGIHAKIQFKKLRLKKDSVFDKYKIALIPEGKFKKNLSHDDIFNLNNERAIIAEETLRETDYIDKAINPTFAFSKLYEAELVEIHVSEVELWNIAQVYEWDDMQVLDGEITTHFQIPPDYVTLQSNLLYERKAAAKVINNNYREGEPYPYEIPESIPESIAHRLKKGEVTNSFFESYYNSTVKGMFNSIYGTQAQDIYKPEFTCYEGNLVINTLTKPTVENFEDKNRQKNKVLYTYGMRIVGGSRQHMVIAMILLYKALGEKCRICGGDTDSVKISVDNNVSNEDLLNALEPLYTACKNAIQRTQYRNRKNHPHLSSPLTGIGGFEVEGCGNSDRYTKHFEMWNKSRISIDTDKKAHVTFAGIPRPNEIYNLEDFITDKLNDYDFEFIAPLVGGYNTFIDNSICHLLQKKRPKANEKIKGTIIDYKGDTYELDLYQAIALYPIGKYTGDLLSKSNNNNVLFLQSLGKTVNTTPKQLFYDGEPKIYTIERGRNVVF